MNHYELIPINPYSLPERQTSPVVARKLHFSPVRCVDLSSDEQLLLTASDDKTLKLSSLEAQRTRFVASYLGHSNWLRAASLGYRWMDGWLIPPK